MLSDLDLLKGCNMDILKKPISALRTMDAELLDQAVTDLKAKGQHRSAEMLKSLIANNFTSFLCKFSESY
jgi:hypothetical protein